MSTRAQIRFATREAGQSFNEHPNAIHAQFYNHSDGYPEGLGIEIAESLLDSTKLSGWDLDYIYYIWQAPSKETFISIFEVDSYPDECETCGQPVQYEDACIFVGLPTELINKYSQTK